MITLYLSHGSNSTEPISRIYILTGSVSDVIVDDGGSLESGQTKFLSPIDGMFMDDGNEFINQQSIFVSPAQAGKLILFSRQSEIFTAGDSIKLFDKWLKTNNEKD